MSEHWSMAHRIMSLYASVPPQLVSRIVWRVDQATWDALCRDFDLGNELGKPGTFPEGVTLLSYPVVLDEKANGLVLTVEMGRVTP